MKHSGSQQWLLFEAVHGFNNESAFMENGVLQFFILVFFSQKGKTSHIF